MFFSRPAARQDFLNSFPPEGEIWLIITFRWDMTAVFADAGEICAETSVKKPHMASGGGFRTYANEEAVHEKAFDHLTSILSTYQGENYTIRVYTIHQGDKTHALAHRDRRAQEAQEASWRIKAEFTKPSPRFK